MANAMISEKYMNIPTGIHTSISRSSPNNTNNNTSSITMTSLRPIPDHHHLRTNTNTTNHNNVATNIHSSRTLTSTTSSTHSSSTTTTTTKHHLLRSTHNTTQQSSSIPSYLTTASNNNDITTTTNNNNNNTSSQTRKYKAVNFDLPPTKRPRRNDTNVQNIISTIQTCVTQKDRLNAIYSACSKFDHDIQTQHDTEIAMGADIALFKHLPLLFLKKQRIVNTSSSSPTSSDSNLPSNNDEYVSIIEEISNTFTALEMVLRCSAESISTCYARIGDELFTFLLEVIQELAFGLSQGMKKEHGCVVEEDGTTGTTSTTRKKGLSSSSSLISEEKVIDGSGCNGEDHGKERGGGSSNSSNNSGIQENDRNGTGADTTTTTTATADNNNDMDDTTTKQNQSTLHKTTSTTTTTSQSSNNTTSSSTSSSKSSQPLSNAIIASKVILRTTTKIIAHFGRVGSLTEALANTPKLLETLCTVISMPKQCPNTNNQYYSPNFYNHEKNIPLEARLNCLWIIANLACSADNMVFMARHTQITTNLFEIVSHPTTHDESTTCQDIDEFISLIRMRCVAIRAILNLSWAQQNKIPLTENIELVHSIVRIASHRKSPWTGSGKGVSSILLQSRRHACGTLRNLAAAPRKYKRRLCRLKNGCFLNVLADIVKYDHDCEVREKILATLFNLVSADTAKMFTEKKDVLNVIVAAASVPDEKMDGGSGSMNDPMNGLNTVNNNSTNNNNNSSSSSSNNNNNSTNCTTNTIASSQKGMNNCRKMAENILRSLEKALPEDDEGYDALRPALHRFDSQIAINRTSSNLGVVTGRGSTSNFGSVSNFGTLPSMSNFSLGDINMSLSHSTLNPETV